jgi:hypothetical protein
LKASLSKYAGLSSLHSSIHGGHSSLVPWDGMFIDSHAEDLGRHSHRMGTEEHTYRRKERNLEVDNVPLFIKCLHESRKSGGLDLFLI